MSIIICVYKTCISSTLLLCSKGIVIGIVIAIVNIIYIYIGYCSGCWEDWSAHSSTCPHCRGEIKECPAGQGREGQVEGQQLGGGHDGREDIWQYESWDETDMHSQLEKLTTQLLEFVRDLPLNLTKEMMTSHCILSPRSSSSSSSAGPGAGAVAGAGQR